MPSHQKQINLAALLFAFLTSCSPAGSDDSTWDPEQETKSSKPQSAQEDVDEKACAAHETSFFLCTSKDDERVSICGEETGDAISSLSYKVDGLDGLIIKEHHWNGDPESAEKFLKNTYHRYKTEYIEISFTSDGHEHRIFRNYDSTGDQDSFSRGVYLNDAGSGEELSRISCEITEIDRLDELTLQLECDKESALGCSD